LTHRNLTVGAIALVSLIALIAFFTETYAALQYINPAAAIASVAVAIIGIIWFRKTAKS
jgi:hypothetical protein